MDYVEGPSLADRLQEGALSVDQTRKLGCRLAGALAEVHAIGVLHRDLSPDNILLPGDDLDQATMIEFGIAKQTGAATTVVGGDFAGKFAYASPEQVEGRGTDEAGRPKLDARSDIYSLGLVLAAAATGRPINMGRTWAEVVEARRRRPDVSAVPAQLRDAIARMLHPQPSRRPSSMRDRSTLLSIIGAEERPLRETIASAWTSTSS